MTETPRLPDADDEGGVVPEDGDDSILTNNDPADPDHQVEDDGEADE